MIIIYRHGQAWGAILVIGSFDENCCHNFKTKKVKNKRVNNLKKKTSNESTEIVTFAY